MSTRPTQGSKDSAYYRNSNNCCAVGGSKATRVVSLRDYLFSFETRELPYHEVVTGEVPGRPGTVALQGKAFPGPATDSIQLENSKQGDTP